MHEVATSRRAVMRALALTPIIIAPALKAAPTDAINAPVNSMTKADNTAFAVALAEYRSARAAFDRSMHQPDADACTLAGNASDDAFERMLLAPAGSIADIATKLEIALVEYEGCDFDEKRLAMIATDVRRLAGEA